MASHQIAQKYSKALFLAAKDRNAIDSAYDQFAALKQVLKKDNALLDFLTAPQIPDPRKRDLVQNVFGNRLDRLFVEFLLVLLKKRRIRHLPEIIDAFERLVEVEKGMVRVNVVTAVTLSSDEERDLVARLETRTGRKILLDKKVDPAILGGMVVIIDDEIIDGSVRNGLKQIEEELSGVKVA